jgi:hypothetical protein
MNTFNYSKLTGYELDLLKAIKAKYKEAGTANLTGNDKKYLLELSEASRQRSAGYGAYSKVRQLLYDGLSLKDVAKQTDPPYDTVPGLTELIKVHSPNLLKYFS